MVSQAHAACLEIARHHYENFPVASFLVPRALRPHIAAVYAFARGADDIADEPGRTAEERLALLDAWTHALTAPPMSEVFEALHETRRQFELPLRPFEDLLSAFKQDVVKTRYESWDEVFDYCRRSANPVGRLVLRLARVQHDKADEWSDAVCTALQLTNFWQDLAVDWSRGRLYVPRGVWSSAGADPADLDRGQLTPAWRAAIDECCQVTERLFGHGDRVSEVFDGRLRYELRATWLGGMRILTKLRREEFDVFRHRPRLTRADALVIALKALTWRETPRSITRS